MAVKRKKITIKDLTSRCGVTEKPKLPGSITPEEQKWSETCKQCGDHVPWSGQARLRGYAGKFICEHCDENYNDEEMKNG